MPDVPEQLRNWSKSLADSIPPTDFERVTRSTTTTNEPNATRRWLAVAASVLVVVAGGVLAVATLGNDNTDRIGPVTNLTAVQSDNLPVTTTAGAPSSLPGVVPVVSSTTTVLMTTPMPEDQLAAWPAAPVDTIPVEDVPRLLPTVAIPTAGTPVRAAYDVGGATPAVFTQTFADAERDILFTLQTHPAGVDSTPTTMRQPVTIDGWDDAFHTNGVGSVRLVASDPSGFVQLMGTGMDPEEAVSILAAMQRRTDGLPGWDLSEAFDGLVEINGAWTNSAAQRVVTWFSDDGVVAQMLTSPDQTNLITQALGTTFERVDVGGAMPGSTRPTAGGRSCGRPTEPRSWSSASPTTASTPSPWPEVLRFLALRSTSRRPRPNFLPGSATAATAACSVSSEANQRRGQLLRALR